MIVDVDYQYARWCLYIVKLGLVDVVVGCGDFVPLLCWNSLVGCILSWELDVGLIEVVEVRSECLANRGID